MLPLTGPRLVLVLAVTNLLMTLGLQTNSLIVNFKPLPDGLLVTGRQGLRRQIAEWNTVVVLEAPQKLDKWNFLINQVLDSLRSLPTGRYLNNDTLLTWKTRLRALKVDPTLRIKRGLFDFIGDVSNKLFGTATQSELNEIRKMIVHSRSQQQDIVHFVNTLSTVVNKTYTEVSANRIQINQVQRALSVLEEKLDRVMKLQLLSQKNFDEVYTVLHLEQVCTALEAFQRHYYRMYDRYLRQRASLEIGRLTEELLPPKALTEILSQGVEQKYHAVDLTWYYQHVEVRPVWGDIETLVYSAKLPLVDDVNYLHYKIQNWPAPYNITGLSIQLEDIGDVGFDTEGGGMFKPHSCTGREPMICRTGPIYDLSRMQCPRGILTGDVKERAECKVTVRRTTKTPTAIEEVGLGEFVVVTWGEQYSVHCQGQGERRDVVSPGVYYVQVPDECTVKGPGWTISGITKKFVNATFKTEPLPLPLAVDLQMTLPEDEVIKLLDSMLKEQHVTDTLKPLEQLQELHLEPLQMRDDPVEWELDYVVNTWWFDVVLIIGVFVVVLVVVNVCYKRYSKQFLSPVPIATNDDIDVICNRKSPVETIEMKELTLSPLRRLKAIYEEESGSVVQERVSVLQDP